jgi:hypothetical protein
MTDSPLDLRYQHVFDIRINFDKRWRMGPLPGGGEQGYTSVGEGSTVFGPRLNGRVVDYSGADWALVRADGIIEADAHYMLEADDGTRIYIHNRGYVYPALTRPGATPGSTVTIGPYFRCTPYFRAPDGPHEWLNRTVIVGVGKRFPKVKAEDPPDHSMFRYYAIL